MPRVHITHFNQPRNLNLDTFCAHTPQTLLQCAANPVPILLGFLCQYSILPLLAVAISRVLNLSPAFSVGLILLGCCPGGQVSEWGQSRSLAVPAPELAAAWPS